MSTIMAHREERTVGRRTFLKGAAAAVGIAALPAVACTPSEPAESAQPAEPIEIPEDEIYQGVCRGNCGGGCRMNVHVRDGKVVKTSVINEADPLDTRICQRGLSHAQRIYAPERLKYPMRRVEGTERGAGEWERLTWEEALDYVGEKWRGYVAEYGPMSLGICFGAGTYAYNQYVYMALFNLLGGISWDTGYDTCGLDIGRKTVGRGIYLHGNDCADVKNSKYIFAWGSNVTVGQQTRWAYELEAIKNGAKYICVDPMFTGAAEKADIWVPINPATDAALALAMINVCIEEGLADEEFLTVNTVAPFLVKADHQFARMSDLGVEPTEGPVDPRTGQPTMIDPYAVCDAQGNFGALGDVAAPVIHGTFDLNGVSATTAYDLLIEHVAPWTPEAASDVCGVEPSLIRDLARMFAEGPTNLSIGWGMDHRNNGSGAYHALFTLLMVTGNMGKPGAGVGGTGGGSTMGTHCTNMLGGLFPEGATGSMSLHMSYLPEIMKTGMFGQIPVVPKSMLHFSGNTLSNMCGRTELEECYKGIDLIITVDSVMTDTARVSDVILPIPHWYEYETFVTCPTPRALFQDQCIEPLYETKTDVEIACALAAQMGHEEFSYTNEEFHKLFLTGAAPEAFGLSWDRIKQEKSVPCAPVPYMFGDLRNEGFAFQTATGRAEFYFENPSPKFNHGQDFDPEPYRLPSYFTPTEAYSGDSAFAKYPLNLITWRNRYKVHTQFSTHPWFLDVQPEPTITINPADAAARGIQEDDMVRAYNDRGYVVLRAHIDAGTRPGMVKTEHTWWDDQYVDGTLPSLLPLTSEHFVPAAHPFDTLVEVEKVS